VFLGASLALGAPSGARAGAAARACLGDVRAVESAYARWRASRDGIAVPLGWSRALSRERTDASGFATIHLDGGSVTVEVRGLPAGRYDVWFVDNARGSGRSATPETGDAWTRMGTLVAGNGSARIEAVLDRGRIAAVDQIVVTHAGSPLGEGLLFGSPSLFQRIELGRTTASLGDLVAEGEALFFEEEFEGNGRTCATCHPGVNNFTLDPEFIASLPPDDPLFVAETNAALAEDFENPVLMRQFGLVLENVDGFEDLLNKFTMRGVPHTFAQALSIAPSDFDSSGGGTVPPFDRTGWSGDGAPGGGTLREFAIGAVQQHFTKTLGRVAGVDFRFPTDAELDAIEAFMLSLGRQEEMNLQEIPSQDPEVRAGHELFIGFGKCTQCHSNGGANAELVDPPGIENVNFDTGVEDIPHPADGTGELRPRDGGFGVEPHPLGGFGDGRFNTPSLVEAADTGPFFHHNAFATIEDAVAFYGSDEFNASPAGAIVDGIELTEAGIRQIGKFLRVINTLENIRSAIDLQERAKPVADVGRLLDVAIADIGDAIEVLQEKSLHPRSVIHLGNAEALTALAIAAADTTERNARIDDSLAELGRARHWIRHLGSRVAVGGLGGKPPVLVTPNPGTGAREISFHVEREGAVAVDIFDVTGRRVASPFAGVLAAGERTVAWDGRSSRGERVGAGFYVARIRLPGQTRSVRLLVLSR
jgi:mono/diheme cytochrome c family protein